MSIESPAIVTNDVPPTEPVFIHANSEEAFGLAAATVNPTHPFLGPILANSLQKYERGDLILEDPSLNRIFNGLTTPDERFKYSYPEMLATYLDLVKNRDALQENGKADTGILAEQNKIIGRLQTALQGRMAQLTNRDSITSRIVISQN